MYFNFLLGSHNKTDEILTFQKMEVPRQLLVLTVQHLQSVANLLQVLLRTAQTLKYNHITSKSKHRPQDHPNPEIQTGYLQTRFRNTQCLKYIHNIYREDLGLLKTFKYIYEKQITQTEKYNHSHNTIYTNFTFPEYFVILHYTYFHFINTCNINLDLHLPVVLAPDLC